MKLACQTTLADEGIIKISCECGLGEVYAQ